MWDLLKRIIGHSSTTQENLMRSKDKPAIITATQLEKAKELLEPLILPAYELKISKEAIETPDVFNHRGKPVPYYGTIKHPQYILHLFINYQNILKHSSNVQLIIEKNHNSGISESEFSSLPMWESLIHKDPNKHKALVRLLPEHPWSLYKKAKFELVGKVPSNQVMGYPQWSINDIDYRTIKDCEFLFHIEITENESFIYFFKNLHSKEIQFFIQKP